MPAPCLATAPVWGPALRLLALAWLVAGVLAVAALPAWAGPAEEFEDARSQFQTLAQDSKTGEYRSSWQALESTFLNLYKRNPSGSVAAKSLYYVGRVNEELGRRSSLGTDYKVALDYYTRVVTRFPEHSWADDALWRMAQIQYHYFKDAEAARQHCKTGLAKFPRGDMHDRFAKMLAELDAPPASASQTPASPAPATSATDKTVPAKTAPVVARSKAHPEDGELVSPAPKKAVPPPAAPAAPVATAAPAASSAKTAPAATPAPPVEKPAPIKGISQLLAIRHQPSGDGIRVTLVLDKPAQYTVQTLPPAADKQLPPRLYLDLKNVRVARGVPHDLAVTDDLLRRIRTAQNTQDTARVVLDLQQLKRHAVSGLSTAEGYLLQVDIASSPAQATPLPATSMPEIPASRRPVSSPQPSVSNPAPSSAPPIETIPPAVVKKAPSKQGARPAGEQAPATPPATISPPVAPPATPPAAPPASSSLPVVPPAKPATPPAALATKKAEPAPQAGNLAEQLGLALNVIMLDPGHGGKDPGAFVGNVQEKDINLNFAKILGRLLQKEGFTVLYTRTTDTFIPLDERAKMANDQRADVFLSIHVNAYSTEAIHGLETYYLDGASSDDAKRVAARENGISQEEVSDLQVILADLILNAKVKESKELARSTHKNILGALLKKHKVKDMGVRSAPFYVLMGARMPAILVELGYITNKTERANLTSESYLTRQAQGLVTGLLQYKKQIERLTRL